MTRACPRTARRPLLMLMCRPSSRLWLLGCLLLCTVVLGDQPAAAQIDKLPHADTTASTFFGGAVAIDGNRALVGASGEASCGENAGAAYLFERDGDTWQRLARLVPDDCDAGLYFGRGVALSGERALVAAAHEFFALERPNAAYVFEPDSAGVWRQTARLTVEPKYQEGAFAASVSLDGDRALVTTWGDPGGGEYSGAAYVFDLDPATDRWAQTARLVGSGGTRHGVFGGAGALDGDRAVVAASSYFRKGSGSVYVFERDAATGRWREAARLPDIDAFRIAVDVDGDRVLVGESKEGRRDVGTATVYARDAAGRWRLVARLKPSAPYELGGFGSAVSLCGSRALVVGYDEQLRLDFNVDRVVYVFEEDPSAGVWRQRHVIDVGEWAFGAAIALDERYALIGQAADAQPGAAYVVRLR